MHPPLGRGQKGHPGQRGRWRAALEGALLLLILALAAWLRLSGAAANPGWFSDEGTHLSIANNRLLGRDQYLAIGGSTLLASRLPAFEWLLAGALWLAGAGPEGDPARGMAALRALTGALGALTTLLVYAVAREREQQEGEQAREKDTHPLTHLHTVLPALLAALLHALYPSALIYSRFGFSYNLLAPVGLAAFWAAGRYARGAGRRWLALAAALAGLGTVVDLWAWVWLPALGGAVALRWWAPREGAKQLPAARVSSPGQLPPYAVDLALALIAAGAPFALYALRQLLTVPAAFLFDLRFVLGRLGALSLGQQAAALAENVSTLFAQDGWLMLGLLGLFALRPARRVGLALLFTWLPILLLGRTTALHSLGFYYLIPLLPWAGAGIAAIAAAFAAREREREKGARALRLALWAAAAVLLGGTLVGNVRGVREGFATAIDPFLLDAGDAQAAAAWLKEHRAPDELALASPALAWLLPGQAADFQMALAYAGQATPHIPPSLPRERYAFSPHPDRARYVVVDSLTRNWGVVHLPGLGALLAEVETWPLVFQAGEIAVYQRPEDKDGQANYFSHAVARRIGPVRGVGRGAGAGRGRAGCPAIPVAAAGGAVRSARHHPGGAARRSAPPGQRVGSAVGGGRIAERAAHGAGAAGARRGDRHLRARAALHARRDGDGAAAPGAGDGGGRGPCGRGVHLHRLGRRAWFRAPGAGGAAGQRGRGGSRRAGGR